jgi:hypothetical protein
MLGVLSISPCWLRKSQNPLAAVSSQYFAAIVGTVYFNVSG